MSTFKINVTVELLYEDGTTRSYTFENVETEALAALKAKIFAINANENDEYANFYKTFVSNDGAKVWRISSAKYTAIEEEVLYNG
ncbi:MAG: hypothetical protein IJ685_03965 [Selenomonadaceae bacterium]|nr:hypothetical protein [Selenomonadaceae bacterium]